MSTKLAVVTGASSGVGLGLATRLAADGVELQCGVGFARV